MGRERRLNEDNRECLGEKVFIVDEGEEIESMINLIRWVKKWS